jgi:hypothetical protein
MCATVATKRVWEGGKMMMFFSILLFRDNTAYSDAALTAFFGAIGLPRLVIVDTDSFFAGFFKQLFQLLCTRRRRKVPAVP